MWDLQRNGGNVAATTERILSGRGLEVVSTNPSPTLFLPSHILTLPKPPPTFQPPLPGRNAPSASATNSKPAVPKPAHPDLITRYNLTAKIASGDAGVEGAETTSSGGIKQAWSQNKNERQALLQRRREEMILAARRKMQAKVAAEAAQGNAGAG
jgi:coupling of ubiquitin conjugation to ER degradation protein 1